ncbi:hypothetical protein [Microcystis phage Mel-JY34]
MNLDDIDQMLQTEVKPTPQRMAAAQPSLDDIDTMLQQSPERASEPSLDDVDRMLQSEPVPLADAGASAHSLYQSMPKTPPAVSDIVPPNLDLTLGGSIARTKEGLTQAYYQSRLEGIRSQITMAEPYADKLGPGLDDLRQQELDVIDELLQVKDLVSTYDKFDKSYLPKDEGIVPKAVRSTVASSPTVFLGLTGYLLGGTGGAMALGGAAGAAQTMSDSYLKAAPHMTHGEAMTYATIDTLAEFAGDKLLLGAATREGGSLLRRAISTMLVGAGEEMGTTALQDFHEFVRINPQMTVKEALENLAVSGLSGATMGVMAGGGGAGIQRAQQYGQEKREERALETLLTEALSARDVRLRTPAETARRLTVFDLEHPFSPGKDWSQVNKIGQELMDPAGTGWTGMWTGEDAKVSLPEIGATRTAPINWRVKNDEEYVAQNYVTEQDLKPAIERLMQASPAAAANFVHSHAAELFGRETLDPDSPKYDATPGAMAEAFTAAGTVTPEQRDEFLAAYEKLLEADFKKEFDAPIDLANELRAKAQQLSKMIREPLNIPLAPFEAEEAQYYDQVRMSALVRRANTRDEVEALMQPLLGSQFRGSVSYYLAQQVALRMQLRNTKLIMSAKELEGIANAFEKLEEDVEYLKATGWVPQMRSPDPMVRGTTMMDAIRSLHLKRDGVSYGLRPQDVLAGQTPGAVTVRPGMPEEALLEKLGKSWLKKFGLSSTSIVILPETRDSRNGSHMSMSTDSGDVMVIWVKPSLDKAKYLETFAHEFGHGLVPRLLDQSPPDVVEAVTKLYNERLRSLTEMTVNEAYRALRGPAAAAEQQSVFDKKVTEKVALELLATDGDGLRYAGNQYFSGYHASFEEFLAHEIERVFARDYLGIDDQTKSFLHKALGALKTIFADFRKAAPDQQDLAFSAFLEYHARQAETEGMLERSRKLYDHIKQMVDVNYVTSPPSFRQMTKTQMPDVDLGIAPQPFDTKPELPGSMIENVIKKKLGVDPDLSGLDADLDRFNWIKRLFGNLITIARDNKHIKELSDPTGPMDPTTGQRRWGYMELAQFFAQERMKWISAADGRLKEWGSLTKKQQDLLGQALYEETLGGTHWQASQLQAKGLSPEAIRIYSEIKGDFSNFINAMEQAAIARANAKHGNSLALPSILQDISARFALLKQKPYFPLTRFGKYLLIVREPGPGGKTKYLEAFDTKLQAMMAVRQAKATYAGLDVKVDKVNETERAFMGTPPALWEAIRNDLNLTPQQIEQLNALVYKMAPDQSFTKHFIQRKKLAGFSRDAQRAYAHYFMHGSGHMAKMAWSEQLQDAVARLRQSANEAQGDSVKRRMIADYAGTHLAETLNPAADWAGLRSTVAVLYLGGMLSSAFVNLTQVPMFTYPHLAAKYGDASAIAELTKAYGALRKVATATRTLRGWENDALNKYAQNQPLTPAEDKFVTRFYGLSPELRTAIERGVMEGFLDESFAMVLAGMANGNMLSRMKATSNLGYYTRALSHTLMIPFEAAEKINRRVTFTAAFNLDYRAAIKDGLSSAAASERAFQAGKEAVQTSQFEYAKWNRPEALRGRRGAFLMFMQYQFNALSFLMGGDKGWWRAWAMLLLMGGAMGLPFAEDIMALANWLLSSSNKKVNTKHEMKKFVEEIAGDGEGLIDHGISRYGFGLKFLGDVSGSVSMGRMIPGADMLDGSGNFGSNVTRGLSDLGGATTALALQMARGLTDDTLPAWKRAELIMPARLGKRILQSYRWLHQGAEKSPNGSLITSFDTESPAHLAEIAANVGGFTPRAVTAGEEGRGPGRERYYLRQEMVRFYTARKSEIIKAYATAVLDRDMEAVREAQAEIRTFNKEVPARALRINSQSLRQSVSSRNKAEKMDREGAGRNRTEQAVERMLNQ